MSDRLINDKKLMLVFAYIRINQNILLNAVLI